MYYCIKCGDPIEPGELRCDKCGYKFTFVEGVPVDGAVRQGTVYMQMSPGAQNAGQKAGAVSGVQSTGQRAGAVPGTQSTVQRAGAAPGTQSAGQRTVQPAVNNVRPAKKKKRLKFLIPLFIILGLLSTAAIVVVVIGVLLVAGVLMLFTEDEPLVVEDNTTNSSWTAPGAVVYDNTDVTVPDNTYVDAAIRDPFVTLKGDGSDTVTIMIYMNGSDLESNYGSATADLKEMLDATLSENMNVIIQTGGTRKWHSEGISNKHSQRFMISDHKLVLIDDNLPQLDITSPTTLSDFITFCSTNYPADRNILIMWDHGGGPVYGFGVDENVKDYYAALTLDEIQLALATADVKFEMIGFDACLMGTLETACALYNYSDYLIASEDFESGDGWEYQNWMSLLGYNSSTPLTDVGKVVVDDYIKESRSADSEGILALIDLRYARLLFSTWENFAYANEDDLLAQNYNMEMQKTGRAGGRFSRPAGLWDYLFGDVSTLDEYYNCVDLMALAKTMETEESKALSSALAYSLIYCSATEGDKNMTGLSVTLPYYDEDFYAETSDVFGKCGFDNEYITFLGKFASAEGSYYDWGSSGWSGDSGYSDDYYYDWSGYGWDDYTSEDYGWDDYDYDDFWYTPGRWDYWY